MFKRDKKPEGNHSLDRDKQNTPFIQPKLAFGNQGDQYEVEADKMADKVVGNNSEPNSIQKKEKEEEIQQKPLASEVTPLIQKMETSEEEQPVQSKEEEESIQKMEEEETVQAKCDDCEKEEKVQKQEEEEAVQSKSENNASTSNQPSFESKLKGGNGGQKMDGQTRSEMESGFGADFSHVSIHNDSEAAQMSQEIGAQAFTHGNDIYFNEGKYNPNSKEGKHLLAHELTHTIQQKGMVQKKVQKQSGSSRCAASDVRNYRLRSGIDYDFMVPEGCRSAITFEAKWEFHDRVSCCTGETPYEVSINGGRRQRMPAGDTHCGDAEPFPYESRTLNTGSGLQRVSIRVNPLDCPGIRLYVKITTVIR
ncbi:uncharacterized protein DUF4157 [Tenacibaculum gallaicum]|uniref:Uncharacterized protein DUF4157 n=1 Tax=Tenacibaculum gallaicum TaxID=561505 RepID=A0A3E0HJL2_9FLAO|nr:DUF4157 domain-containing protein [Tenacibaculum gallaicum]REH46386.1 uncharacterized protein DUF4157 [Tenacibaculum gallaicum]